MKQAVVIVHGMGEQVPMETLRSFVRTVWTEDDELVAPGKPDPNTGGAREENRAWHKPDNRTRSYELRRITTESDINGRRTDFFEFYWAHLIRDTTWEQVRSWLLDLLWRNPFRRVPKGVLSAWLLMWAVFVAVVALFLLGLRPAEEGAPEPGWLRVVAATAGSAALGLFVSNVMVGRFGDVVRYVKARPGNVARRQEIRKNGVDLLETLIESKDSRGRPAYDRIIVVGHSLGAIVAYDMLSYTFARVYRRMKKSLPDETRQPQRAALEQALRRKLGLKQAGDDAEELTLEGFRALQDAAREELCALGTPWPVSDFVTLGAPLTHAEFLLAKDRGELLEDQLKRLFPTCPPTLEHDQKTGLMHFSYRKGAVANVGKLSEEEEEQGRAGLLLPRTPHHGAIFAYTRWTNLYSPHRAIVTGDIVSGPVGGQFGLQVGDRRFSGIKDIAVMPALDPETGKRAKNHRRRFLSHNSYWSLTGGTERQPETDPKSGASLPPHHIRALRDALGLGRP